MDCQGAQQEPEGRPEGPGDLKLAGGSPLALLHLPAPPGLSYGSSLDSIQLPGLLYFCFTFLDGHFSRSVRFAEQSPIHLTLPEI